MYILMNMGIVIHKQIKMTKDLCKIWLINYAFKSPLNIK